MATSGTNPPPPVCKVKLVKTLSSGETPPAGCTPVSQNTMFVVLSDNPNNDVSASVNWDGVSISLTAEGGNNLILSGTTNADSAPDTVTVIFDGCTPTSETCDEGTCVPTGC